ncbi:MAG: exodeoxyribonuclease III, partial [Chloroflexi bacterium]|nr:exodeoxyribonuclease III [Chloroflexota bacterium]
MKITTWNVNSIRAREDRVLNWLDQHQPDVLCLQELKCTEEQFPFDGFDALGYNVVLHGQKSYNGVAIVSLDYPDQVEEAVPWPEDDQSRGIAAEVNGVHVVSLYCPNGREVGHEMYRYKLEWFDHLRAWLDGQDQAGDLVLTGDYNITFDERDVNDPEFWRERILCSTPERERLNALIDWGLTDALRLFDE